VKNYEEMKEVTSNVYLSLINHWKNPISALAE
jgi:hypothetical protein